MNLTNLHISEMANNNDVEFATLKAFIDVESGGIGFDKLTGKLIIQFEPHWFRRKVPFAPSGKWSLNKVENQKAEWIAFNDAYKLNPNGAMEATSIGMPQIMGFHYKRLGYATVGAMWDDFKQGEYQQILALVRFIKTDKRLYNAIQAKDWHTIATLYNGAKYAEMAKKWGREPYNISLEKAYKKYLV